MKTRRAGGAGRVAWSNGAEGVRLPPSMLTFGRIIAARGLRFPADPRSRLRTCDVFSATAFLTMWRVIGCGSLLKTGSSVYLAGS